MSAVDEAVKPEDIHKLLGHFAKSSYKAKDADLKTEGILQKCLTLFNKDYKFSLINNANGDLCSSYPSKIVLLEYETRVDERVPTDEVIHVESIYDLHTLREVCKQARFARCRARFVIPVILYNGKHICRSSTLSGGAEIYGRSGFDFFFTGGGSIPDDPEQSDWQLFDRVRGQDIRLLKMLNVGYICDLMVEKKKVKFGMNVTSSEKVDKERRYSEFCLISTPYPGCEFFKDWRDSGYAAQAMLFDWNQGYVDATLDIPAVPIIQNLGIDWDTYKGWDLIELTQNYMRLLLQLLREGDTSVLVHCISGWDRTPLFVSLLRLSLWADGVIHTSLSATEILYLTIAYDWYLFGHSLSDRVIKGEEIFYFCFQFLTHLSADEYSVIIPNRSDRVCHRNDSGNLDPGILIDIDNNHHPYNGSDTSINSAGCCSVDNGPVVCNSSPGRYSPLPARLKRTTWSRGSNHSDLSVHFSNTSSGSMMSSSPVTVPMPHRKHGGDTGNRAESPVSGSWQIISSCGSVGGCYTVQDSSSSTESHLSGKDSSASSCSDMLGHTPDSHTPDPPTPRAARIETVRRIFHNAYSNTFRNGIDGKGGITTMLDQFIEKVGFRPVRGATV